LDLPIGTFPAHTATVNTNGDSNNIIVTLDGVTLQNDLRVDPTVNRAGLFLQITTTVDGNLLVQDTPLSDVVGDPAKEIGLSFPANVGNTVNLTARVVASADQQKKRGELSDPAVLIGSYTVQVSQSVIRQAAELFVGRLRDAKNSAVAPGAQNVLRDYLGRDLAGKNAGNLTDDDVAFLADNGIIKANMTVEEADLEIKLLNRFGELGEAIIADTVNGPEENERLTRFYGINFLDGKSAGDLSSAGNPFVYRDLAGNRPAIGHGDFFVSPCRRGHEQDCGHRPHDRQSHKAYSVKFTTNKRGEP